MPVTINGNNTPTAGGAVYGDGTNYASTAAGTSGQVLTSNGSSAPTWGTVIAPSAVGTSGQVLTSNGTSTPGWATLAVSGGGGSTASGNTVLTSSSNGAQAITTTTFGQTVTLPDATTMTKAANNFNIYNAGEFPLKVLNNSGTILGFIYPKKAIMVGLADNSTAAGVWVLPNIEPVAITAQINFSTANIALGSNAIKKIALDANRMFLLINGGGSYYTWGIVYNSATQTWGSVTLITSNAGSSDAVLVSTDKIVVANGYSSTMEAVVVSISGTTISVGSPSSTSISSPFYSINDIIEVNGGAVISFGRSTGINLIAVSVSGTTASIGSQTTNLGNLTSCSYAFKISSTTLISFSCQQGAYIACYVYTVSGNTLTQNSSTTFNNTASYSNNFRVVPVGSRWAVIYNNDSNYLAGAIVSVSGTTVSSSLANINTSFTGDPTTQADVIVSGSKVIVGCYYTNNFSFNILTDSSGTASAGTSLNIGASSNNMIASINVSGNYATFIGYPAGRLTKFDIGFSGSSPTLYSTTALSLNNSTNNINYFVYSNSSGLYKNLRSGSWLKASTSYNLSNQIKSVAVSLNQYDTPSLQVPYFYGTYAPGADNESWVSASSGNAYTSNFLNRIECAE